MLAGIAGVATGIGRNGSLNIGVEKSWISQFSTMGGPGETFPPPHP